MSKSPRLTEVEVRARLDLCSGVESAKVVDEMYDFGLRMAAESLDQIKGAETKATSFAAYGTAVATLLVSSSSTWLKVGNTCSLWIGVFSGVAALACTYHAVQALLLTNQKVVSEDDWLNMEVLKDLQSLKCYRILSMWAVIDYRIDVQRKKTTAIARAQIWLAGSVGYLAFLLFQLAVYRLWGSGIMASRYIHEVQCWETLSLTWIIGPLFSWCSWLLCICALIVVYLRSRRF